MTLQTTKFERTISAAKECKDLKYIQTGLDNLRAVLGAGSRHTVLAQLLDNAIIESSALTAAAEDYVNQNV